MRIQLGIKNRKTQMLSQLHESSLEQQRPSRKYKGATGRRVSWRTLMSESGPLVISQAVFDDLDEFHQAAAIVLQRRGSVIIKNSESTSEKAKPTG